MIGTLVKIVIRIPRVKERKMTYQIVDNIAMVNSKEILIKDIQSAVDFMMTIKYETNCNKIALNKEAIVEKYCKNLLIIKLNLQYMGIFQNIQVSH